jgi:hypothetical protein
VTSRSEGQAPFDLSARRKPLEHFRARSRRLVIHPTEKWVLWIVGAHLMFLPWALGAMRPWAQIASLGLAILGLTVALLPRHYTEEHTGGNRFKLTPWPKLVRFPLFWLGLAFLAHVTVQALNPSWAFVTNGQGWWMQSIEHKSWLPTGVDVPFERWGPWRMLVIYASAWLTVCSIWIGFTRRRTVQLLLIGLAGNGLLLALLGLAQRLLPNGKIFWSLTSQNASFFSSFVYKNHAGAYLDLMLALTCGLAAWYYLRGLRRLDKSNPSGVFVFFATCIAVGILTSYARGATLVMLVFLFVCVAAFAAHQFLARHDTSRRIVAVALVLIFGFFLKTGMEALRSGEAWDRLRRGVMREDLSLEYRERATRAALEMLGENWSRGVGAGSFRFLFPIYQHRHPELVANKGARMFWEHAHNDVVQFPIELGAVGIGIILVGGAYWIVLLSRSYFWENPLSAAVVFGALLLLAYSWWDFPFQNPAILITWCALWPAVTRWTQFEER